jgi:tRNA threonylcarbamoyladenosine biosynthesis protein TsaB
MTARLLLALDASAGPATVALLRDDRLLGARRLERKGSAELLAPAIASVLADAGAEARDLTDIVVGAGPGSFTGLRVAAALAMGLARGCDARLHAVSSLALIAACLDDAPVGSFLCVLDALRGEWFVQRVTHGADASWSVDGPVERVAADVVRARATATGATLVGPPIDTVQLPDVCGVLRIGFTEVARDRWEPDYGRLAEAQVVWEATHARALPET